MLRSLPAVAVVIRAWAQTLPKNSPGAHDTKSSFKGGKGTGRTGWPRAGNRPTPPGRNTAIAASSLRSVVVIVSRLFRGCYATEKTKLGHRWHCLRLLGCPKGNQFSQPRAPPWTWDAGKRTPPEPRPVQRTNHSGCRPRAIGPLGRRRRNQRLSFPRVVPWAARWQGLLGPPLGPNSRKWRMRLAKCNLHPSTLSAAATPCDTAELPLY